MMIFISALLVVFHSRILVIEHLSQMNSFASRTRLMCRACQHQSSVTAGTIFDKTRTPLRVWLAAAWYLINKKQGASALGLQLQTPSRQVVRDQAPCPLSHFYFLAIDATLVKD
jgi:hypothetical protein